MIHKTQYDFTSMRYIIKFVDRKKNGNCQGLGGRRDRKLLFNRYRVSVLQGEKSSGE